MKKIKLFLVGLLGILSLSSCGNIGLDLGNFTFTKVHITLINKDVNVIKWYDNDFGVEVVTDEYGTLYLSEGTYILLQDKCPICDGDSN